jgi:hypothetical protein
MPKSTVTSIRVNADLVDEAKEALGAKSRAEAVAMALCEIGAMDRFRQLMNENAGKLRFAAYDE